MNVSASGAKLEKEQGEEMEFDNESDLTGFRIIDYELFVGYLLCPDCTKPLAAGIHSSTTEKRTGLASKLTFNWVQKCICHTQRKLTKFMR